MEGNSIVENLVQELIFLLNDSSLNCNKKIEHTVKSISSFFDAVHSNSELDLVFSQLFNPEKSLLYFIEKGFNNKNITSGVKEALLLALTLFNKFKDQLSQYIVQIKDVCYTCVRDSTSAEIQDKAYQVITTIIGSKVPLPPDSDINVNSLITFIFNEKLAKKSSLSPTVLGCIYELFGAIAQHYPANCSENIVNSVVRNILAELKKQIDTTKDVKPPIIKGCMLALKGILVNFTRGYNEDPESSKAIYSYVKVACAFQDSIARKMFQRAALELLTVHLDQMWGWTLGDYRWWLQELSVWASRQREDKYAGVAALFAFHRQCWTHLAQSTDSPADREMAQVLLAHYKQTFTNPQAAGHDIQLAIEGFGALASVASRQIQDQDTVTFMFRIILQRAQMDCIKNEDNRGNEQLGKYLESLSNICRELKTVNTDQLAALQQLTRLLVANYPYNDIRSRPRVVSTLCTTVLNMSLCEGQLFDGFLYSVVYQGIIVSCGQCLAEDAEITNELTGEDVVTYRNFLPLWTGLLGVGYSYSTRDRVPGVTPDLRRHIFGKLHGCLIKSLLEILNKLDVGYQKQNTEELEMKADPKISLKGTKPEDHNILCNLANLYNDLLRTMDGEQLIQWLPELITTVINHSVRLPLVSGFYKLLAAVLSVADRTNYFEDESEDRQSLGSYVLRYLEDVVIYCKQYKNDLQASSLLAVIAAPVQIIQPLLGGISSMLQIIFQLGQGYLTLAHSGMDALERWHDKLPSDQLKPVLHQVLPSFDPYLRSAGILTEEELEVEELKMSKSQQKRAKRLAESSQLSKLQLRMLKLLSKLDSATCLSLLRQEATSAVAWTTKPMLNFKIPFPDQRPIVCLDVLLPRVVELALSSSDRQTKAAACEVLHAFVILFIGLEVSMPNDEVLTSLLSRLMPVLLRLGCGSDPVAKQLFQLLVEQMMHWFSSRRMLSRPEQSAAVLEAIWDGVTQESDTALQDFSASCLREFVSWAIKESSPSQLAKSPAGIKAVVRQINVYCVHPSLSKRIGAALAFNHLASLLREHTPLVEKFWVELLYYLVRNLALPGSSENHPAFLALDYVLKVIQKKVDLFNKKSNERRVPPALEPGQLRDVVRWLLQQCGHTTPACAKKCRHLVKALTPLVPGWSKLSDLAEGEDMVKVCEGGGSGALLPIQPSLADGGRLQASLNCYHWCIENGLISSSDIPLTPRRLVPCVEYFVNVVDLTAPPPAVSNREISAHIQTKCLLIESLFDLLSLMGSAVPNLPFTFWNKHFWKLVALCVLRPHEVGFDWRKCEDSGAPSLTDTLRKLLHTLSEQLSDLQDLHCQLSQLVKGDCQSTVERLALLWQGLTTLELGDSQYVQGLGTLHRTNLLQFVKHGCSWNGNTLLRGIFSSLFDQNGTILQPDLSIAGFTNELLSFAVLMGAEVDVALSCVMDSAVAQDPGSPAPTTKGQHFLLVFEEQLVTLLLTDPTAAATQLLQEPTAVTVPIVLLLLNSCRYSTGKKQLERPAARPLVEAVATHWDRLARWARLTVPCRTQLVGLVQAMVKTASPATEVGCLACYHTVVSWLHAQITDPSNRPEYKADVIDLLPAVVHESEDQQLQQTLRHLQENHFPLESSEWQPGSVERDTLVTLYQALLRVLVTSGSITVLQTVTCAAADKEHVCADSIHLALCQFMKQHPKERQEEALKEVYNKFSEESSEGEVRLRLMENFLIPMILKASYGAFMNFYTEKIQTIIEILEEKLHLFESEWKSKQQLVRRIGALQLVAPLLQRVNLIELDDNSELVKAAKKPEISNLRKYFGTSLFRTRQLDCNKEQLQGLFRRMQCCAYKSLMTLLCNINKPEDVCSTLLFKDDKRLWRKLVPTTPQYTFPIVFDDYPKMKKQLVQIRSLAESCKPQASPYLASRTQSLFNSSLQDDITRYDFSMYKVRDKEQGCEIAAEQAVADTGLELEVDSVNEHECMATLCAVVKHLCDKFPLVQEGQAPRLPPWMEYLKISLNDKDQPFNCRVFIIRLILNCQSYFRPQASFWVGPVLKAVIDNCFVNGLNFLIHDIVRMLYDWHPVYVPSTTEEQLLASDFLRRLVLHTPNERVGVFKYNVEVVKCLVSMWKAIVTVPYQELMDLITKRSNASQDVEPGILLADVFLAHQILPFSETGKARFYEHLLTNLKNQTQSIYKSTASVIGKILRTVCEEGSYALTGSDLQFLHQVQDQIAINQNARTNFDRSRSIERFIYCLHRIQANYPAIVKSFVVQCIAHLDMPASFCEMLVECLTTALDFDFRLEAFSLLHSQLPKLIMNNSIPDVQVAALKFLKKLMLSITPGEMAELLPAVISQNNHKSHRFRLEVYDIVAWIYDNYKPLKDDRAQARVKEAQAVLVIGLTDPDVQLRNKNFQFWTFNDHLSQNNSSGRLVDILRLLYSPSCEDKFLPIVIDLLLQICEQTNEFDQNIFRNPLQNCPFEKYHVSGSWRTQHAAFVPMFADTLTSQLSSASLNSLGSLDSSQFQLRATQSLSSLNSSSLIVSVSNYNNVEASLYTYGGQGASLSRSFKQGNDFGTRRLSLTDTTDGEFKSPESILPHRRLLKDQNKVSREMARQNVVKADKQQQLIAERKRRKEGEVQLTRSYRKGDIPDIEIPYSSIIRALQTLARRDQLVARQLLVCLYKGLASTQDHIPGLSAALDNILQTSTCNKPVVMATVLEMCLVKPDHCSTPAANIADVCKNSHQMSLGVLLLEAKLMADVHSLPPAKRARSNTSTNDWVYLAELYHSMEEKDVVQGLFEHKIAEACAASVKEALQFEDQGRWKNARQRYDTSLLSSKGSPAENFLHEARFKCFAHLSEWTDLNRFLKKDQLDENLNNIWIDDWNKDHLLPWLFLTQIHGTLATSVVSVDNEFSRALAEWLADNKKADHIKSRLGEYLSVVQIVNDELQHSKVTSEHSVLQFLSLWQQLDCLSNNLRSHHLLRLQSIMDIHHFLSLPSTASDNWGKSVFCLLKQWEKSNPTVKDDLVTWETRAVYRQIFASKLEPNASDDRLRKNLKSFKVETQLKILRCALEKQNFYVSRKYIGSTKNDVRGVADYWWELDNSRCFLLRAKLEPDPTTVKVDKTLNAWNGIKLLQDKDKTKGLEEPLRLALLNHTAEFYSTLLSVVQENPVVVDQLDTTLRGRLEQHLDHMNGDISAQLKSRVVDCLQRAVGVTKADCLANSYLRLARFCHQQEDPVYYDTLIQSLLRAMKHGSAEARRLFPCILELPLLSHKELFITESRQVPEWMFLTWVSQLLASLDTNVGSVLAPLLVQLATAYPKALQFPFQLSCEMYKHDHAITTQTVAKLKPLLALDIQTATTLKALACVCQPHNCLLYHLERLTLALSQSTDSFDGIYRQMKEEAYPPEEGDKIKGTAFNDLKAFTDKIEENLKEYFEERLTREECRQRLVEIRRDVDQYGKSELAKSKQVKRMELRSFSPWLANGYESEMEIPGQYTGESRPLPQQHITIAGFKRHVKHLFSLRRPIQVTVLGNDAKDHRLLVKFGEDLRQDQRIQQLFVLMNHLLREDPSTSSRGLSVDTYMVSPLNSRLGVIEWVDETVTLRDFMVRDSQLQRKADVALSEVYGLWFEENIKRNLGGYKSIKREQSIAVYRRAINTLPPFMLRDAVWQLAASPEAFVHLRAQMLTSHACLSLCHWLLGIGDRHLSNTLVRLDTGRFLGIDFGYAFGTATMLHLPELMPIRLTPQIVNLASPLNETGLLKETMVHTLQVMRENHRILLATMSVFINEPSLDWLKCAQRHSKENNLDTNEEWYPREKVAAALSKLQGAHPRAVTAQDLRLGHVNSPHYAGLLEVLYDDMDAPWMRDVPEQGLTARQQVECLIAQATNEHILSKTFYGWQPYI